MKRTELIRHLKRLGCLLVREGAKHTVYTNPATGLFTTVPRHRVIKKNLALKICDDLGIPRP